MTSIPCSSVAGHLWVAYGDPEHFHVAEQRVVPGAQTFYCQRCLTLTRVQLVTEPGAEIRPNLPDTVTDGWLNDRELASRFRECMAHFAQLEDDR